MATSLPVSYLGLGYVREFTRAYQSTDDVFEREAACERVQFPATLVAPRPGDLLAGKRIYPEVGYSPQYGGLGYYLNAESLQAAIQSRTHSAAELKEWEEIQHFWEDEQTAAKCWGAFDAEVQTRLPEPFDPAKGLRSAAYPLYRMAGLVLDYEELVKAGLPGLLTKINERARTTITGTEEAAFCQACRNSVNIVVDCLRHYEKEALGLSAHGSVHSRELAKVLCSLQESAPRSFHQALQLVLIFQCISGTINFGRLDTVLGPLLRNDLDTGTLTWERALELMRNFYRIIEEEIVHFDGRIVIGGKGRADLLAADCFARLAMETTASLNLPMPQLTLRFHANQERELLDYAYEIIGKGKTFPMLYNDDVNIPAVCRAFDVSEDTAETYVPFGCGEYLIPHQSCDTPNAIINLQRCLESAINHGRCFETGARIGPDLGSLAEYANFEELWNAYTQTVEHFLQPLAKAQAQIYTTTGMQCPFGLISLLTDDCLKRGKPIFAGGIRILGGTNETYGNTNAADSLGAIRYLLYEKKSRMPQEILTALERDWQGPASLLKECRETPKYGNDIAAADEMLCRVHDHICRATAKAGSKTTLDHFLVVVINNNCNTLWGNATSASTDGRSHRDPLAPGNAPGAGADRSGLTAVLNSQARPDPTIHAGTVQNAKLSASFPKKHPELYRALFDTYFNRGGTQAMITVTSRDDLLAALEHPEEYANLLVRVGGFSARFIDLDPATQREILSRTEHGG